MTSAAHWFELGREVADFHARSTSDKIAVLPIILEDLGAARPILRALNEVLEGNFFDASTTGAPADVVKIDRPVMGTTDPVRRAAVTTSLASIHWREIRLADQSSGLLDVEFDAPRVGTEPSAGDRILAAIIRAAVHDELDRSSFAIISYESGVLDWRARKVAWELMLNHLNQMPNPTLKTLVVAVEAAIDIELHCQTGRGFRFAVERNCLLRRQGSDHLRSAANRIIQHCQTLPIVLFLGAGFSASSGMPLGDTLRDKAIRRILGIPSAEPADSRQLGIRFHEWLAEQGSGWIFQSEVGIPSEIFAETLTLERVTSIESRMYSNGSPTLQEFKENHDQTVDFPGSSVSNLATILRHLAYRVILVQVNFDCLLERNADTGLRQFVTDEEFSKVPEYVIRYVNGHNNDIPLLKLHGTIDQIETCIVSQDQTEYGVGVQKLQALRSLFDVCDEQLQWIYVGVSMRDRDLLPVLGGEEFGRELDETWVLPYIVPSVREFAQSREPFWKRTSLPTLQDRVITETSDAFFQALADGLPGLGGPVAGYGLVGD